MDDPLEGEDILDRGGTGPVPRRIRGPGFVLISTGIWEFDRRREAQLFATISGIGF